MKNIFFLFIYLSSISLLAANIHYRFVYNAKDKKCIAYKNNKKIPNIDKKLKIKFHSPYTCSYIQIQNYRGCKIKRGSESITAYAFSFGSYGAKTKLMVGFMVAAPSVDASLELQCSKKKFNFKLDK